MDYKKLQKSADKFYNCLADVNSTCVYVVYKDEVIHKDDIILYPRYIRKLLIKYNLLVDFNMFVKNKWQFKIITEDLELRLIDELILLIYFKIQYMLIKQIEKNGF